MARRGLIEISARVPENEYDTFRRAFPQLGAIQWFIETSLRVFNQRLREEPGLQSQIEDGMERMIEVTKVMAQVRQANGE